MSFVDQIRAALNADTRTSEELGNLADVHPVNLRHFKSGSRGLSIEAMERVAKVLGLEIRAEKARRKR